MAAATKAAQNIWISSGGQDFLQLISEGGAVLGWIDYTGTGQGNLAGGGGTVPNFADEEVPSGSTPGTSFTLAHTPNPAKSLQLYWNGVLQKPGGVDYTLATASITTVQSVQSGDSFVAWYRY
jgi:hypothetical protein